MLENAKTAADALQTQRCSAVHRHGRDGGGGANRGARAPGRAHGGRPAGSAGARHRASRAAQAALAAGRIGYTETLGIAPVARAHRPPLRATHTTSHSIRAASSSPPAPRAPSCWRFWRCSKPGDRVALANPGYPPYRHILSALGCEPVLIETSAETRWAMSPQGADRRAPATSRSPAWWSQARPTRPAP